MTQKPPITSTVIVSLAVTVAVMLACTAEPLGAGSVESTGAGPDSLYIELTAFKGMTYQVNVRGQEVLYRCQSYGSEVSVRWATFTVSREASVAFFSDLDRLGAFRWNARYPSDVVDGEWWSLEATVRGRHIQSFGSNAQPRELDVVVDRVRQFLARFPFGFSGVPTAEPDNCLVSTLTLRNHVWNAKGPQEP
jgi:hypothetical protein